MYSDVMLWVVTEIWENVGKCARKMVPKAVFSYRTKIDDRVFEARDCLLLLRDRATL